MTPTVELSWFCLECQTENSPDNFVCSECGIDKPTECDTCGELMTPWREGAKSKLEKWTCRTCYFQERDHPNDNIDRDEGEDR